VKVVERVQLRVSRFVQVFWLVWAVVVGVFLLNSLVATLRAANEADATGYERLAPFIVLALGAYLAWCFWWRLLPEFRPMAELRVSDDELVVVAPAFLREPLRVPRGHVSAGVIDQPNRRLVPSGAGTLSAAAVSARSDEGFGISALVLHSSWPNLVLFFEPPAELARRRLRAWLLFPRQVGALLAQVADPGRTAAAFEAWRLPLPRADELDRRRPRLRVKIARELKFGVLAFSAGGAFVAAVVVGAAADSYAWF
jgi:hypothetical protein